MLQVEIAWNFETDHNVLHLKKETQDGDWATILLKMDSKLTGGFEGALEDTPQQLNPTNFSLSEWHDLISDANIFIGKIHQWCCSIPTYFIQNQIQFLNSWINFSCLFETLFSGSIGNEMLLSTKNTYITDGESNDVSLTDQIAKRSYKVSIQSYP